MEQEIQIIDDASAEFALLKDILLAPPARNADWTGPLASFNELPFVKQSLEQYEALQEAGFNMPMAGYSIDRLTDQIGEYQKKQHPLIERLTLNTYGEWCVRRSIGAIANAAIMAHDIETAQNAAELMQTGNYGYKNKYLGKKLGRAIANHVVAAA